MRGGIRGMGHALVAGAAALATGAGASIAHMAEAAGRSASGKIYGAENIRRYLQQQKRDHMRGASGSIATGNRWGGPHEHKRERARNARRARA